MNAVRRTRLLAVALVTAVIACVVAWQRPEPPAPPSAAALAEARLAKASALSVRPASPFGPVPTDAQPAPDEPTPAADPPPAGMTPPQWRDLQDALKDHPGHVADLRRVAAYMAFKDTLARFQAAREQAPDSTELQALARQLDAALDARLAQGDLTAAEAHALKSALLQVLEPDATRRSDRLARWAQAQSQGPAAAANPRQAQYVQRQAAILAAWQAQPAGQRNPQQLEAELEALRLRPAPR